MISMAVFKESEIDMFSWKIMANKTDVHNVSSDFLSREATSLSTEGSGLSELSLPDSISGKVHKRPVRSPDSLRN